jgi:thiol-disulfide isomerase/thioredoxin
VTNQRGTVRWWLALMAITLAVSGCGLQPDIGQRNLDSSFTQLPSLSGPTIDGGSYTLVQSGHPAVVDFWASWCGPCRQQQPELNALAKCFAANGVIFIGVDIRDDRANAAAYAREFSVPYPSIDDPSSDLANTFDVAAPPTTLVVDGTGHIVLRRLGGISRADVGPTLAGLLGATSPGNRVAAC